MAYITFPITVMYSGGLSWIIFDLTEIPLLSATYIPGPGTPCRLLVSRRYFELTLDFAECLKNVLTERFLACSQSAAVDCNIRHNAHNTCSRPSQAAHFLLSINICLTKLDANSNRFLVISMNDDALFIVVAVYCSVRVRIVHTGCMLDHRR